ncbi:acetyl-CoA synthetase-like protein [Aspergillus steynii IBT 23096]|uniref:Acetyl-CoA synthetase-like protein n=1 Tax=Aspergillus steynii IBT 23096 TaxID=1392250 RepID=A0A2I2G0B8_9EURO|nr:acetyl-CoA synthetase-like protein [Aspergillus steynii IBT 23096]PLB46276.1 acetyl-CoA synthetase-like protein [Aspergillus steynii IBT 23096]
MSPSNVNGEISSVKRPYDTIIDALRYEARHNTEGIVAYPPNDISEPSAAQRLSYKDLLHQAEDNASRLYQRGISTSGAIVLLHFETNLDSIIWYWSVLLTGGIPVITGPGMFSPNAGDRKKHLTHLYYTLDAPNCLTRKALEAPFAEQTGDTRIQCFAIEDLVDIPVTASLPEFQPCPSDSLAVMLTSGSSGQAKAVPLTHHQLLAAFKGKTAAAKLQYPRNPFLSWVHMDHVANLVHCHLFAIVSGISQIQVSAADVLVDPVQWLNLLSRHRVSRTFAPNFLFAKLRRQLAAGKTEGLDADLNLEALYLDTGGEANVTEVCAALEELLKPYRIPKDVFKPSFGMTETCAGCIFNSHCPSNDRAGHYEFASLGEPMPGVQMRVIRLDGSGEEAEPGERGSLEVTGEVIFKGYHNNETATAEAFTSDGWFRTGDLAYLDAQGHLHLDGRTKEMININGVKYLPHELDAALEQAEIPGTTPSYFCCFGTRDASMDTEVVAVLYLPSFDEADDKARFETQSSIIRVASLHTHSRPKVVPLCLQDMPKSTLGKLSRTKLQAALECGQFTEQQTRNDAAIKRYRQQTRGQVETTEEAAMLDIVRDQLEVCTDDDFGVCDSLLATGATSMDLVAIMQRINRKLQLSPALRLTDVLNHPTVRGLANRIAVTTGQVSHEYDPVVTLQPFGHKTPLWLVHPGVGEVLVFVTLAHHFTDRPVYAFRAKGFNAVEGETPFNSLDEVFETYRSAIKKRQPHGPYAIAGYSFGGMVAFEITKLMERDGDEVRYCGSWNLPPHIKFRMRELLWDECVIHLFYFVGLMDEATAYTHKPTLCAFERENRRLDAIRYLRKHSDAARWDELGLSEEYYLLWVGLASNMQGMAIDYDPQGSVKCMDVFVADPLSHVAKDRKDWVESRLAAWKDFVRQDVRFHDVQGAHYTMLNPEYVASFADTLRAALKERGL